MHQRPFNGSKRALLLYDDDTALDFEQVCTFCFRLLFTIAQSSQLKAAIHSMHIEVDELVAMKLQGLTRQQVMQVMYEFDLGCCQLLKFFHANCHMHF